LEGESCLWILGKATFPLPLQVAFGVRGGVREATWRRRVRGAR